MAAGDPVWQVWVRTGSPSPPRLGAEVLKLRTGTARARCASARRTPLTRALDMLQRDARSDETGGKSNMERILGAASKSNCKNNASSRRRHRFRSLQHHLRVRETRPQHNLFGLLVVHRPGRLQKYKCNLQN